MMRFVFLVYFINSLKLASTEIKCGMPAYPVRESDYNSNRIIGGWEARPHSLPWQLYVLLRYKTGLTACGGTIIQLNPGNSTNLALTAAHCMVDQSTLKKLKPENASVIAGAHNIADLTERTREQYDVKSIIIHQNFKNGQVHDIALLILQSPILYSTKTRPICLPDGDEIPEQKCWIAGWGYTRATGGSSHVLLMISTPMVFYSGPTLIAENFKKYIFLAGSKDGGAYQGDSGGPFFCKINNVYVQYGIVAHRPIGFPPGSLSTYVRLSTHLWKMMRFVFLVYFINSLKLASTEIKCGMPAYPVRESDYNSNRIIGGWEARPHSLPWQLYVLLEYEAGIAACGGTIIQLNLGNSTNLALTSAHCMVDQSTLKKLKPENVSVIAGAHNVGVIRQKTHKKYNVKTIIIHENFQNGGVHDIALLILQSPIFYSRTTRPICLPDGDEMRKKECWVAGWGCATKAGDSCPVLLMVSTPKIFYGNDTLIAESFRKYIFLAGSEDGGPYRGDSGGPLFCKINNVYVQYGIVSYRPSGFSPALKYDND
ncbi:Plasma kallikrein [Trichinella pseudospiralis]|uniref:Plasma kallikrein n=1 Tax=Trichinella pseudospiralis TaxID=6337 RepID=A0A0V1KE35_TRIPS|nr:Plasma kallikrein [Trichinella pseudospiralis]